MVLFSQLERLLKFDISNTSTETLFNRQYYLKNRLITYILGNNAKPFTSLGEHSDSGYIQLIYGMGFISFFLYLLPFIYLYIYNRKNRLFSFLIIVMIILSIKGSLFYSYIFLDYLFLILSINKSQNNKCLIDFFLQVMGVWTYRKNFNHKGI